jgi:hypothetical protein
MTPLGYVCRRYLLGAPAVELRQRTVDLDVVWHLLSGGEQRVLGRIDQPLCFLEVGNAAQRARIARHQRDEQAERLFDFTRLVQIRLAEQTDQRLDGVYLQIQIAQRTSRALELGRGADQAFPPLVGVRGGRRREPHLGFPLAQLHDAGSGARHEELLAIGGRRCLRGRLLRRRSRKCEGRCEDRGE